MRRTTPNIVRYFPRVAAEDDQQFPYGRTSRVVSVPLRHVSVELVGRDLRLVLDVPRLQFHRALDPSADVAVVLVEHDDRRRGQPAVGRQMRRLDPAAFPRVDHSQLEFLGHGGGELRDVGDRPG
jgi:hypothetical protein